MKQPLLFLLCLIIFIGTQKASAQIILNGNLENIDSKTKLPVGWQNFMGAAGYTFALDSATVHDAKYSVSITSKNNDASFGSISCVIPYVFTGHKLQLKGFIKTENVVGQAGLWLRVDGSFAINNMADQNIHGTTGWKEYTINLYYNNESATNINVGGLLTGKGKMWFSNVRVYMDGVPIEQAPVKAEPIYPAQSDTAFAKESGIGPVVVNYQVIKNLTLLGQVWGFLKYHHPMVAKGNFNMDAELFRVMPSVIQAQNTQQLCDAIERWIDKLGTTGECNDCTPENDKSGIQQPDYGEIFDRLEVTKSLADKLAYIYKNRNKGPGYYIDLFTGVQNPNFKHELPYSNMHYPDAGYRLLCLFRYWNMIQYFYADKHLIGEDWNKVLPEFIPKFVEANNTVDYELATLAIICRIHDTHANMAGTPQGLGAYRGKFSAPFEAKFIEGKLTVTGYFNDTLGVKDNLKIGDVITGINGNDVDELVKKYLPITPASNYETQLRVMPGSYLLRSNSEYFAFDVLRDGKTIKVSQQAILHANLNYGAVNDPHPGEPGYRLIDNQVGYLHAGKYHMHDLPAIEKMFKETRGIIVDMRTYPSDNITYTFVPFIKTGDAPFVKFTFGSLDEPGLFTESHTLKIKPENKYTGKVIVIVNAEAQSAAEFTTMAFQSSPNVTVIGSTTAGADGNVSTIVLPGGLTTLISGIGVLYPDGTETQRKGVKIDELVRPTITGIKAGIDELLERAKAIILGGS